MDSSPSFPPELERIIFQLAAWNDRRTTRSLLLVAHRVWIWIEPLLYRVILFDGLPLRRMLGISSARSRSHIHHLALSNTHTSLEDGKNMVSTCPNITNLAVWSGHINLAVMHSLTQLTRLSISPAALFPRLDTALSPERLTPFPVLSHLEVFDTERFAFHSLLNCFPALTHLAFGTESYDAELVHDALRICNNSLRVVVALTNDLQARIPREVEEEINDPRFCVVECTNYKADWLLGAWGGRDFWCRAEERLDEMTRARQNSLAAVDSVA
ncbi:hypothetical protein C8F01DRAFT_1147572 [Mycena amicta]|nr:hypothetical protein C8F01DRAFT_1147572 [Mycena amicta]